MTTDTGATRIQHTSTSFSVDIQARTTISAPASAAWAVLTDTASYPEWNPFVRRLEGELQCGSRLEVELQLGDRKPQRMRPTIVRLEAGRGFEWLGRVGFPGVLDGRHRFEIRATDATRCELVHAERLSGVLVPAFRKLLTEETPAAFVACNEALKCRVESAR